MKVLLIIVGIFILIGCIPVGARFCYDGTASLRLVLGPFRPQLFPKKPLTEKQKAKKEAKKAKKAAKKEAAAKKKKAASLIAKPPAPPKPKVKQPLGDKLAGLLPWAKLGVGFVGEFFHRRLYVRTFKLRAALAGGDPAKTAEAVGRAWQIVGMTLPILDKAFRVKRRQIAIWPDFTAAKTDVAAELDIRVTVGGLVILAVKYACKAIKTLIHQKKQKKIKQKGGEPHEQQSLGNADSVA